MKTTRSRLASIMAGGLGCCVFWGVGGCHQIAAVDRSLSAATEEFLSSLSNRHPAAVTRTPDGRVCGLFIFSEGASEAFYGSLAGLDPLGLVLIDPDNPNMQGGQYVGLAGGMCLGGTGEIKAGLAAAKGVAKKALAKCKRIRNPRLHHPWPQYLGGPFKQVLEKVPKSLHDKYHSGLDKLLPRKWGTGQLQRPVPTTAGRELRHALQVYRGVRQAVRHPPH